jgi:hypothetical protein
MHRDSLNFIIHGLQKFEPLKSTKIWHIYIYFNIKILESETSMYFNTMHLYHVHTTINIPSLNNEDQSPRQQHHVTVISLLIKRAAVILAKQQEQFQCTMDCYFWGNTGKCPYTFWVFSSVIMQFCVTQIFYSDWAVFTNNFVRVVGQSQGSNGWWLSNTVWTLNKHKHSPF